MSFPLDYNLQGIETEYIKRITTLNKAITRTLPAAEQLSLNTTPSWDHESFDDNVWYYKRAYNDLIQEFENYKEARDTLIHNITTLYKKYDLSMYWK